MKVLLLVIAIAFAAAAAGAQPQGTNSAPTKSTRSQDPTPLPLLVCRRLLGFGAALIRWWCTPEPIKLTPAATKPLATGRFLVVSPSRNKEPAPELIIHRSSGIDTESDGQAIIIPAAPIILSEPVEWNVWGLDRRRSFCEFNCFAENCPRFCRGHGWGFWRRNWRDNWRRFQRGGPRRGDRDDRFDERRNRFPGGDRFRGAFVGGF